MRLKLFILSLIVVMVTISCGKKKPAETVSESETVMSPAPVAESKMMIIANLVIKPEKVKDFTEAAKEIIELSNKEAGCSFYQLYQNPYDNSKFVFVEEYTNQAAVDAHFATEHFNAFGPRIGDMIVGAPEIKIITVGKEVIQ
jgi:quinol monooxygenase YgiN